MADKLKLDPLPEGSKDLPNLEIGIRFGALAPRLLEQLKAQVPTSYTRKQLSELRHLQLDADALVRLKVRGVIAGSAALKVQRRLVRKITNIVRRAILA